MWPKYEKQIMSTDAVQVRVIGITHILDIDALNNLWAAHHMPIRLAMAVLGDTTDVDFP